MENCRRDICGSSTDKSHSRDRPTTRLRGPTAIDRPAAYPLITTNREPSIPPSPPWLMAIPDLAPRSRNTWASPKLASVISPRRSPETRPISDTDAPDSNGSRSPSRHSAIAEAMPRCCPSAATKSETRWSGSTTTVTSTGPSSVSSARTSSIVQPLSTHLFRKWGPAAERCHRHRLYLNKVSGQSSFTLDIKAFPFYYIINISSTQNTITKICNQGQR